MRKNGKILVCGAGGYVGGNLVETLIDWGFTNIRAVSSRPLDKWLKKFDTADNYVGDLRDPRVCDELAYEANYVFNLAATVGGIGFIGKHKVDCMMSSIINTNLLRASSREGVLRYFFASSSCVYPENDGTPLREGDAYPAQPLDGYGWDKLFSERMCLAFEEEQQLPVTIARFHTVYGPGDIRPEGRDHVTTALCKKVIAAKRSGNLEIEIWGDGSQTRNFLHIKDCIYGVLSLMSYEVQGPINLANPESVSINSLVTMLEEIAGVKLKRAYKHDAPRGRRFKVCDTSMLREHLRWEPAISLRDGLEELYKDLWDKA